MIQIDFKEEDKKKICFETLGGPMGGGKLRFTKV